MRVVDIEFKHLTEFPVELLDKPEDIAEVWAYGNDFKTLPKELAQCVNLDYFVFDALENPDNETFFNDSDEYCVILLENNKIAHRFSNDFIDEYIYKRDEEQINPFLLAKASKIFCEFDFEAKTYSKASYFFYRHFQKKFISHVSYIFVKYFGYKFTIETHFGLFVGEHIHLNEAKELAAANLLKKLDELISDN